VIPGENGFLVPVKSAEELANAMLRFLKTPNWPGAWVRAPEKIAEKNTTCAKSTPCCCRRWIDA
jgi:glycosyltransferase involved in cell wall biosynthesis